MSIGVPNARFHVLMAASMKMIAFLDIVMIALMMEAVQTSKTSVYNKTMWHNTPESYHLCVST
jgi:hypothetical protein